MKRFSLTPTHLTLQAQRPGRLVEARKWTDSKKQSSLSKVTVRKHLIPDPDTLCKASFIPLLPVIPSHETDTHPPTTCLSNLLAPHPPREEESIQLCCRLPPSQTQVRCDGQTPHGSGTGFLSDHILPRAVPQGTHINRPPPSPHTHQPFMLCSLPRLFL